MEAVRHHMGSLEDEDIAIALIHYLRERYDHYNLSLIVNRELKRPFGIYLLPDHPSETYPSRNHDFSNSQICEAIRAFESGWKAKT